MCGFNGRNTWFVASGDPQPDNAIAQSDKLEIEVVEVFWLAISRPPNLLFGLLKQHLGGRSLRNNEEVKIAVREWLRI